MDDIYFRKVVTTLILGILLVVSFFLIKPLLMAIVLGVMLAFIFNPIFNFLAKRLKSKDTAAGIVCFLLILIIVIPFWFLTPIFIDQSFKVYVASQQMDFVTPLRTIFPSLFASETLSAEVGSILFSFVTRATNIVVNLLADLIVNFVTISLQFMVVLFTLFFVLRDRDELIAYIKSLSPFSKDVEEKLFKYSTGITISVLYGQVIIGIIQGLVAGMGFLIFGVPNALLLTLVAALAGILPIIGTALVWIPVTIYLLVAGNLFTAIGVGIFGVISSTMDNFLRPYFVSKMTHINPAVILIGMIGGIFLFGPIGFVVGPLVLSYLLVFIEFYRKKNAPGVIFHPTSR